MWRRWIIRSLFLGLLLLCVGGWGGSCTDHAPLIGYAHMDRPNVQYMAIMDRGTLYLCRSRYCMAYPEGLFCQWAPWRPSSDSPVHFLGFSDQNDGFFHWSGIPFWFLTTLSGSALFFIWRHTGQRNLGGAFPVEMKAKEEMV